MVNYYNIYRDRTYEDADSVLTDEEVLDKLDTTAQIMSRKFATPWGEFSDVDDTEKYVVVLVSAKDFWWKKLGEFTYRHDQEYGDGFGQKSDTMFSRALQMIKSLEEEIEKESPAIEGSGEIIVGNLFIRSKETGYLIPRRDDPKGNWVDG